jgi:hypothetical protein
VLNAVATENPVVAVIHQNGKVDDDLIFWLRHNATQIIGEANQVGSTVELSSRRSEQTDVFIGHFVTPSL